MTRPSPVPFFPSSRCSPRHCAPEAGSVLDFSRHNLPTCLPPDTPARRSPPNPFTQKTAHRVTPPGQNHRVRVKARASATKPTFSSEGFGGEGLSPTNVLFKAEVCACPTPCVMVWPPEFMAQGPEGRQAENRGEGGTNLAQFSVGESNLYFPPSPRPSCSCPH